MAFELWSLNLSRRDKKSLLVKKKKLTTKDMNSIGTARCSFLKQNSI